MTHHQHEVWIVDDDHAIRWVLERALAQAEIKTRSFDEADKVIARLRNTIPDAIVTDIRMPGKDGIELLADLQSMYPSLPVIVMTAHSDMDSAVSAYDGGAFEYLPKPFDIDEAVDLVRKAARLNGAAGDEADEPASAMASMIGQAPAMQRSSCCRN